MNVHHMRVLIFCLLGCLLLVSCYNPLSSSQNNEPRPIRDYENLGHYTEEEALAVIENEYEGDFSIVKTEAISGKKVYTVVNRDFPGLEFCATSHVSKGNFHIGLWQGGDFIESSKDFAELLFRYQYEAALAQYLTEKYVQNHQGFEVSFYISSPNGTGEQAVYCFVSYYYDSFDTIEEQMKALDEFAAYVQKKFPFNVNQEFYLRMISKEMYYLSSFESEKVDVNFTKDGFSLSYEDRLANIKADCMNWIVWSEYNFEFLPEGKQAEYFEELKTKAQETSVNQYLEYYDYPIHQISYTTESFYDKRGLRVGSFYLLCGDLGLEPQGSSAEFEVIGADGSCYRFANHFRKPDGEDYLADRGPYYYYKNDEPIPMPGGKKNYSVVSFSIIEEVLGYPLVEHPNDT